MRRGIVVAAVAAMLPAIAGAGADTMPPPVFKVEVTARANVKSGGFRYTYDVKNSSESTLELAGVEIVFGRGAYETVRGIPPQGWSVFNWFNNCASCPPKQSTDFEMAIDVANPEDPKDDEGFIKPGTTVRGFVLVSTRPPAIDTMNVDSWTDPWFDAYYAKFGDYPYDSVQDQIRRDTTAHVPVLGPMDALPGTFKHWDRYLADVAKAAKLAWIPDAALAGQIQNLLSQARQAAGSGDSAKVTSLLDQTMTLVQGASADQITMEPKELVLLNAQVLKNAQPAPYDPVLELLPASSSYMIGQQAGLTAHYYNRATGLPLPGDDGSAMIHFEIASGPNAGMSADVDTAPATGKATWSYRSVKLGIDHIHAEISPGYAPQTKAPLPGSTQSKTVTVTWAGGADLRVRELLPPLTIANPGDQVTILKESTVNAGNIAAGPSITLYYVTRDPSLDPKTYVMLGERAVPSLNPGESSDATSLSFTLPDMHTTNRAKIYLVACADATNKVVETDEANNCSTSNILDCDAVGTAVKKGSGIVPGSERGIGTLTLLGILGMILLVTGATVVLLRHGST